MKLCFKSIFIIAHIIYLVNTFLKFCCKKFLKCSFLILNCVKKHRIHSASVFLSNEIGVAEAAKKLGIPYYTLAEWRKSRSNQEIKEELQEEDKLSAMTQDELKAVIARQKEEIERLRKAKSETEEANEILKDALGFFVQDRKKQK